MSAATHTALDGGMPARRAVLRWSMRLYLREWRQQVLICVLIAAAVATTILAAGIVTGGQVSQNAAFGSANEMAQLSGSDPHLAAELAALRAHFGEVDVIESVPVTTGTVAGAILETFDPSQRFVHPIVQLTAGRFPTARDEVDLSASLASLYRVGIGGTWRAAGQVWHVVGEVREPTALNATFALAAPGAIAHPESVTALFDATADRIASFKPPKAFYNALIGSISSPQPPPSLNVGELIVLIAATFGMLFIGLVAVAGFSVMGNRRTRAIGMLGALGAPESRIRQVLLVNGVVVGFVAMVLGGAAGLGAWWLYAPHQQASVGHVVDPASIPWWLVVVAMLLAPVTATIAATRPARALGRLPVVAALSGRPTEPKASRRNATVGLGILVAGALLCFGGAAAAHGGGSGAFIVLIGIACCCVGLFLVSQWVIGELGHLARHAPLAVRIALRDLARYRSRSGAALGAICLAMLITGVVVIAATARYSDPYDWVGPNLASNVVVLYAPASGTTTQCTPTNGCKQVTLPPFNQRAFTKLSQRIAVAIGATSSLQLLAANVYINRTTQGRGFNGPGPNANYVATPALLAHYGIQQSSIDPNAMLLTSRPGLTGNGLAFAYGQPPAGQAINPSPCPPGYCVNDPLVQYVPQLPTGTSAPNVVVTMHAMRSLHLTSIVAGELLTTRGALTPQQKQTAATLAGAGNATIETANAFASLNEVLAWSLTAGLLLALGVLAMTVGLIRSETAAELRVLTATGASRRTRRALTSATASALGFVGAVLGIVVAYVVTGAFFAANFGNNFSELTRNLPLRPLGVLLFGLPIVAAAGGWLFAGREPRAIGRQPLE